MVLDNFFLALGVVGTSLLLLGVLVVVGASIAVSALLPPNAWRRLESRRAT